MKVGKREIYMCEERKDIYMKEGMIHVKEGKIQTKRKEENIYEGRKNTDEKKGRIHI